MIKIERTKLSFREKKSDAIGSVVLLMHACNAVMSLDHHQNEYMYKQASVALAQPARQRRISFLSDM